MTDETYLSDCSHFDKAGPRFLFPFTDVEPDLIQCDHELGWGWRISRVTWSQLEKYGVRHHLEDWQTAHFGPVKFCLPNGYMRIDGKYKLEAITSVEDWRFCMVWADETNVGIDPFSISQALAISDLDMRIGAGSDGADAPANCAMWPQFVGLGIRSQVGLVMGTGKQRTILMNSPSLRDDMVLPNPNQLESARQIIEWRRQKLGEDHRFVLDAICQFMDLDRLHDYSSLKHLGYFAIIESLLSHSPNPSDPVDSISRQIKRNLQLVGYRLSEVGSDLSLNHFGDTAFEKTISRLYSYRSAIAHGGDIATALANIDKIRPGNTTTNMCWIHDILRSLVRRVLQSALREPELFRHLK